MNATPRILVVAEGLAEAEKIGNLLRTEYDDLAFSTDPERVVEDFEQYWPKVLVLAFATLEQAERYALKLYGQGALAHTLPHRTLILCGREEARRSFELCKKEIFDDYLLFRPQPEDPSCLLMAVHRALRQVDCLPTAGEFAAQARRIAGLEALLEQGLVQGGECLKLVGQALQQAGKDIGGALDAFSCRLETGERPDLVEVRNRAAFQQEVSHLKAWEIEIHLQAVATALQSVRQWAGVFKEKLAPQLASARALQSLTRRVRPVVLVVDDDEYQLKLLAQLLAEAKVELVFAASGSAAVAILRKCRPDLVLMDINLPDIDGVQVTRRLKAAEPFAAIPVIMITGHSGKQVVIESLKAGAVDFVVKPFDKPTLLAKLRKFL